MTLQNKNNKFISYLIILVGLFVLILFTKDQIYLLQENMDLKESYSLSLQKKKDKLDNLNKLKNDLEISNENISKYNVKIKEDEIIDYIHSYIESTNGKKGIVIVKSIIISESIETEIGFRETVVNLNFKMPNEERLKEVLDFLTSPKSKYNFYINSFTFPYGRATSDFNVSIPLKILHK